MSELPAGILTVSALNSYVADSLRMDPFLQSVRLTGQISGFKVGGAGHWYFSLKDEESAIDCAMFRQHAMKASFRPANGDQVIVHGRVGLYTLTGRYQFYCDSIRPTGTGLLWQRFEELKRQLREEGLFDQSRKRSLPRLPGKIAVVTSEAGAVWHDICHVAAGRDPRVRLCLVPVQVQGEGAAASIAAGLFQAASIPDADLIIVGRGGGSMEDLWCFNEPEVAYAIAASPLPVISAVGHETDFTIADFVADVRAATPSNAAELAVPSRTELNAARRYLADRLDAAMRNQLRAGGLRLAQARRHLAAVSPEARLAAAISHTQHLQSRLLSAARQQLRQAQPRIAMASLRMDAAMDALWQKKTSRLRHTSARLEAISPKQVLSRGYAIAMAGDQVVRKASDAPQKMELLFADGKIPVRRIENGREEENEL